MKCSKCEYLKVDEKDKNIGYCKRNNINVLCAKDYCSWGNKKLNLGIAERCAMCGEVIPEGREVCPICKEAVIGDDKEQSK